jgi:hypothetical protein
MAAKASPTWLWGSDGGDMPSAFSRSATQVFTAGGRARKPLAISIALSTQSSK